MLTVREDRPGLLLHIEEDSLLGPRRPWIVGLLAYAVLGAALATTLLVLREGSFPALLEWGFGACLLAGTSIAAFLISIGTWSARFPIRIVVDAGRDLLEVADGSLFHTRVVVRSYRLSAVREVRIQDLGWASSPGHPTPFHLTIDLLDQFGWGGAWIRHIDLHEELLDLAVRIGAIGRFSGVRVAIDKCAKMDICLDRDSREGQIPLPSLRGPADYAHGTDLAAGVLEVVQTGRDAWRLQETVETTAAQRPEWQGPYRILDWQPGSRIRLRCPFRFSELADHLVPMVFLLAGGSLFLIHGWPTRSSGGAGIVVFALVWLFMAALVFAAGLASALPIEVTIDWAARAIRRRACGRTRTFPMESVAAIVLRRRSTRYSMGKRRSSKTWYTYQYEVRARMTGRLETLTLAETWSYRNDVVVPREQARALGRALAAALGCPLEMEEEG